MTIQTEPCKGGCGRLVPDEGQYGYICLACWEKRRSPSRVIIEHLIGNDSQSAIVVGHAIVRALKDAGYEITPIPEPETSEAKSGEPAEARTPPRDRYVYEVWGGDGCESYASHGLYARKEDAAAAALKAQDENTDPGYKIEVLDRPVIGATPGDAMGARPMRVSARVGYHFGGAFGLEINFPGRDAWPIRVSLGNEIADEIAYRINSFEGPGETEKGEG